MRPTTPTYPGVYIEEIPSGVRTIAGVGTSITAFVGYTARGPLNDAVRALTFADFEPIFGGLHRNSEVGYAFQQFFERRLRLLRGARGHRGRKCLSHSRPRGRRGVPCASGTRPGRSRAPLSTPRAVPASARGRSVLPRSRRSNPISLSVSGWSLGKPHHRPMACAPVIRSRGDKSAMNSREIRPVPNIVVGRRASGEDWQPGLSPGSGGSTDRPAGPAPFPERKS